MLKKLTTKEQIYVSLGFVGLTVILMSIAMFGILHKQFAWSVVLNYFFFGLVLGIYSFVVLKLKYHLAFILYSIGYGLAFLLLFFVYVGGRSDSGFTDLGGLIGMLLILVLVMVLGIALEILRSTRVKIKREQATNNDTKREYIDAEIVDSKSKEDRK